MTDRANNGVLLAARLLMAAALLPTGLERAVNVSGFALTLAGAGLPAPNALATAAVVVQVFGPLALVLGTLPRVTGLALAVFVAAFAAVLHPFWHYAGASAVTERAFLLADLGLAGACLIYAMSGPGAWSWQGWRAGATLAPRKGSGKASGRAAGDRPVRRSGGRAPARAAA